MNVIASRRAFLRTAAAAGSWLAIQPATCSARAAQMTGTQPPTRIGRNSLITVVTQAIFARRQSACRQLGLHPGDSAARRGVLRGAVARQICRRWPANPRRSCLLAGDLRLSCRAAAALADCVKNGGALIGIGGTSGLDEVFGVRGRKPDGGRLAESDGPADHRVTAGLRSSLHVFGGCVANVSDRHARWPSWSPALKPLGAARSRRTSSARAAHVLLAPDLIFSIVHIQQGPAGLAGQAACAGRFGADQRRRAQSGRWPGARLAARSPADAAGQRAGVP